MQLKTVAITAAKRAGKQVMNLSKKEVGYSMKNARDILSEADLASEKIIIDSITAAFPDHDILSEEAGHAQKLSPYRWLIDPVDGTINYAKGFEEYAIVITVEYAKEIIFALIYQPVLKKLYTAEKGKGAYLNGKRITVSNESSVINCLAATDNTSNYDLQIKNFTRLTRISTAVRHVRIFGSMALHFAKVAQGHLDFYFKEKPNYWDSAGGALLITEAGGKVTDFAGNPFTQESRSVFASNGIIHTEGLALLNDEQTR